MASTTFEGPLRTGIDTGNPQTSTIAYVPCRKVSSIGFGAARTVVTLPPKSTLWSLAAVPTSAFTGGDSVTAMTVSFGTSSDATRYGVVTVSALGRYRSATIVSGATDFDVSGGTVVITLSAEATSVFTGGGVRTFVSFVPTGD